MDKSKGWWGGFAFGLGGSLVLTALLCLLISAISYPGSSGYALSNLAEGAWTASFPAKVFTSTNVIVVILPIAVWGLHREWYAAWFLFLRKLPTMIGMLGTLWSLVESNMGSPESLAKKFSVAIVSTFLGLILQIVIELVGSFPCFKNELDKKANVVEEE